jgi:hypothetical protein
MLRVTVEQLRPLLVAWLVLMLPVVCHHETAVFIFEGLSAARTHTQMAAGHHSHADPRAPARHADPASSEPTTAWACAVPSLSPVDGCEHFGRTRDSGFLHGMDAFAIPSLLTWPLGSGTAVIAVGDPRAPDPPAYPPTAPPPRALG